MTTLRAMAAVLAVAGLLGACAPARTHNGGGLSFLEESSPRKRPTTIKVTNNNWANVNVFILRGGTRYRLGMVTSMATTVFRLPEVAVLSQGDVRLMVDPIGSDQPYLTQPLVVNPGDKVEFNVQNQLSISSVSIWNE